MSRETLISQNEVEGSVVNVGPLPGSVEKFKKFLNDNQGKMSLVRDLYSPEALDDQSYKAAKLGPDMFDYFTHVYAESVLTIPSLDEMVVYGEIDHIFRTNRSAKQEDSNEVV